MKPISIKRYPNRKLYDTVAKRYITLGEIRELVCSGKDIAVTDRNSGEDITASVLTQVIMEQGRLGESALPHSVLVGLIRARTETLEMLNKFLPSLPGLRSYIKALDIPTREDIQSLSEQIEMLERAVDGITPSINEDGRAG